MNERAAEPGELCVCGRPAVVVFVSEREVGYCGVPDGGGRTSPCPFCGSPQPHRQPWSDPATCPKYRVRPEVAG